MAKKAKAKKAKSAVKKPTKKVAKKNSKKVLTKSKTKVKKTSPKKTVTKPVSAAPKLKMVTTKSSTNWQDYLSPLYDKVLLQKEKQELISKGGLYLGEAANDTAYAKAKVLAVGKGLVSKKGNLRPPDVKEGDTVLFSSYAGNTIKVDGLELVIVKEEEILGIMEK